MNFPLDIESDLTTPSEELIQDIASLEGDIAVLGVGGKVGPSVAIMAKRAIDKAGLNKEVFGIARFSDPETRTLLDSHGVRTLAVDLTDDQQLDSLPDTKNVIYMAGAKFGTTGNEHFTWMMNSYLPGRVAQKFRDSRIVAFSTLLTYPMADVRHGGSTESDAPGPLGEYAASCVGRERVFEHFALKNETPLLIFRLGYSIETRYGVLQEIAQTVFDSKPVSLEMSHASVIWQRDVAEYAIRSLNLASTPPRKLNITGPEIVSVRWLAEQFGRRFGKEVTFEGQENETAYVMDGTALQGEFGYPSVTLHQMIERVSEWTQAQGPTIGKPTKFQQRNGQF